MPEARDFLVAGRAALADAQWDQARDAFEAAHALDPSGDAFFGMSEAVWWLGDLPEALRLRERAFALFRDGGDPVQAALGALYNSLDYFKQYGDAPAAIGWLARAARIIDGNGLDEMRAWLLFVTSYTCTDPVESEELALQAEQMAADMGDRVLELCALSQRGAALVAQGRVGEGVVCLDESMAVALGADSSPDAVVFTSCTMMTACTRCADLSRAVQWVRRTIAFTERYGCPFLYAECRIHYGAVLLATGDWPAAEEELQAGREMTRGANPALHRLAVANLAALWFAQGRVEDVERLVADDGDHAEMVHVQAALHLWHGRHAAAVGVLRRRLAAVGGDRLEAGHLAELLGEAELAGGDVVAAADRGAALVEEGDECGCELVTAWGHRLAGRAAHAAGDADAARRHLDAALVAFSRLELCWEALRTRGLLAAALEDHEPEVAAAEARAALATAERMGAGPVADAAAGVLRRLGVAVARSTTAGDGVALTGREEQVLGLVGEGLSNPEIAARLHLSRKTVEHHVAHVLSKLGVRNRTEAAAEAVRRTAGAAS